MVFFNASQRLVLRASEIFHSAVVLIFLLTRTLKFSGKVVAFFGSIKGSWGTGSLD